MSNLFLSIIIPAYNAEKYIERCLESVYVQKNEDLEIVIVNDGSTDRTEQIVHSYIKRHEDCNISMISIPNGGLANARNVGWGYAKGKYFINLDADDFLVEGIIDKLREKQKKINFDCCIYGFQDYDEADGKISRTYTDNFQYIDQVITGTEAYIKKVSKEIWICQGSACYKKSILKEYNIHNIPGVNQGEDFYFIMNFLSCSERVVSVEQIGVTISYRHDSMMHVSFNDSHLQVFQAIDHLKREIVQRRFLDGKSELLEWADIEFELERIAIAKRVIYADPSMRSLSLKRRISQKVPEYRKIDYSKLNKIKKAESFLLNHSVMIYILIIKLYRLLIKREIC